MYTMWHHYSNGNQLHIKKRKRKEKKKCYIKNSVT